MKKHTRKLAHAAIIAALYAVLTHFQNILLPGSATWAIQLRLSEALCILAFEISYVNAARGDISKAKTDIIF